MRPGSTSRWREGNACPSQRRSSAGPGTGGQLRAEHLTPGCTYPAGGLSVRLAHGPSTHEQLECIRQAPGEHFSVLFHLKGIQLAPCLLGNVNQMAKGSRQSCFKIVCLIWAKMLIQPHCSMGQLEGARPSFCKIRSLRGIKKVSRKTVDFRGCSTTSALRKSTA